MMQIHKESTFIISNQKIVVIVFFIIVCWLVIGFFSFFLGGWGVLLEDLGLTKRKKYGLGWFRDKIM